MKKVVRLTESELIRLIERVISEQEETQGEKKLPENPSGQYKIADFFTTKPDSYFLKDALKFYKNNKFVPSIIGDTNRLVGYLTELSVNPDNVNTRNSFCSYLTKDGAPLLIPRPTNPKLQSFNYAPVKYLCNQNNNMLVIYLNSPSLTIKDAKRIVDAGGIDYSVAAPYLLKST